MSPVENLVESTSSTRAEHKKIFWLYVQVALLCVLVIGVWSLLSLPIVFYNLPISEISSDTSGSTNDSGSDSVCSAPLQYATTSGVCLSEMANILTFYNCSPDPEGNILVVKNEEVTMIQLINGLKFTGATTECIDKAVPFLCLYLFGLCGESGISIQPTSSQCEEIRDIQCQHQWMLVEKLDIVLPDCKIFPDQSSSCPALNESISPNGTVMTNTSDLTEKRSNGNSVVALECSEDFYQENGSSVCIPSCHTWKLHSKEVTIAIDVLVFIFAFSGFVAAIVLIIISCLSYKRMLTFPSIFIVYMDIGLLILEVFIMVGYMDRKKLFCSSRNLFQSISDVTPFCVVTGIVSTYVLCQLTLWWLFHTAALFWKVIFPFHAQAYEVSKKNKYIHIMCIMAAVLISLVPIITILADTSLDQQQELNQNSTMEFNDGFFSGDLGFGLSGFPTIQCSANNLDAVFYSLILIMIVCLASGYPLLIIIFWGVHKFYIKRKESQSNLNLKVNEKARHHFTLGTAEKKILIVLCYYVVLSTAVLASVTLHSKSAAVFDIGIQKYFFCEQGGYNPSNPCSRSDIQDLNYPFVSALAFSLICLFPVVNLIYAVSIKGAKESWKKISLSH